MRECCPIWSEDEFGQLVQGAGSLFETGETDVFNYPENISMLEKKSFVNWTQMVHLVRLNFEFIVNSASIALNVPSTRTEKREDSFTKAS